MKKRKIKIAVFCTASPIVLVTAIFWSCMSKLPFLHAARQHYLKTTLSWYEDGNDTVGHKTEKEKILYFQTLPDGKSLTVGSIRLVKMARIVVISPISDTEDICHSRCRYVLDVAEDDSIALIFSKSLEVLIRSNSSLSFGPSLCQNNLESSKLVVEGELVFNFYAPAVAPIVMLFPKLQITASDGMFRVRDLPDEDTSAIFCYRGKTKVATKENTAIELKETQRATLERKGHFNIHIGDFPSYTWMSTELTFDFTSYNLEDAMKEIANWYGIKNVVFGKKIDRKTPGMVFVGKLSRYFSLAQLLEILSRQDLQFKIYDQAIYVGREKLP